jgi:hypothetical protein
LEVADLVYICDRAYGRTDIVRMEMAILDAVGFAVAAPPSAHTFFGLFLPAAAPAAAAAAALSPAAAMKSLSDLLRAMKWPALSRLMLLRARSSTADAMLWERSAGAKGGEEAGDGGVVRPSPRGGDLPSRDLPSRDGCRERDFRERSPSDGLLSGGEDGAAVVRCTP